MRERFCPHPNKILIGMATRWPTNLDIVWFLFGSIDGAVELAWSRNKCTRKDGKSFVREMFVARYIPIAQLLSSSYTYDYLLILHSRS